MNSNRKENVQYITAILFLISGIVMAFFSYFDLHDVAAGVLTYVGEAVALTAGVFSINIYVRSKISEAETRLSHKIDRKMKKVDDLVGDKIDDDII